MAYILHFRYPFLHRWAVGCRHILVTATTAAVNTIRLWAPERDSGYIPRGGIAESCPLFSFMSAPVDVPNMAEIFCGRRLWACRQVLHVGQGMWSLTAGVSGHRASEYKAIPFLYMLSKAVWNSSKNEVQENICFGNRFLVCVHSVQKQLQIHLGETESYFIKFLFLETIEK